jgi:hypothetical protein
MHIATLRWAKFVYRPGLLVCDDDETCTARVAYLHRHVDPKMNCPMPYLRVIYRLLVLEGLFLETNSNVAVCIREIHCSNFGPENVYLE